MKRNNVFQKLVSVVLACGLFATSLPTAIFAVDTTGKTEQATALTATAQYLDEKGAVLYTAPVTLDEGAKEGDVIQVEAPASFALSKEGAYLTSAQNEEDTLYALTEAAQKPLTLSADSKNNVVTFAYEVQVPEEEQSDSSLQKAAAAPAALGSWSDYMSVSASSNSSGGGNSNRTLRAEAYVDGVKASGYYTKSSLRSPFTANVTALNGYVIDHIDLVDADDNVSAYTNGTSITAAKNTTTTLRVYLKAPVYYAVTTSSGGSGTVSAPASVKEGGSVVITATPAAGFTLDKLTVTRAGSAPELVQAAEQTNGTFTYTLTNVTTDVAVAGTFKVQVRHTVSWTVNGTGTVSVNGSANSPVQVVEGKNATITFTPGANLVLGEVTLQLGSSPAVAITPVYANGTYSYTLTALDQDAVITAKYRAPKVVVLVDGQGSSSAASTGAITGAGTEADPYLVGLSDTITLALQPTAGASTAVSKILDNGADVRGQLTSDSKYSFAVNGKDHIIHVYFTANEQLGGATSNLLWTRSKETPSSTGVGGYLQFASRGNWTWSTVANLDHSVSDPVLVWDAQHNPNLAAFPNGTIDPSKIEHQSATWETTGHGSSGQANLRRFQAEFKIPENFSSSDYIGVLSVAQEEYAGINGGRIMPINDNMYVFVYKKGETITNANYLNYLAFWTGTSNQNGTQTFHGISGTPSYQLSTSNPYYSKMIAMDGWYANAELDNIGASLYANYPNANGSDGNTYVVDVIVEDYSYSNYYSTNGGGMDALKLNFTKASGFPVTINYYVDSVSGAPLATDQIKDQNLGDQIVLSSSLLNAYKPTGYRDGEQQGSLYVSGDVSKNVINVLYTRSTTPVSVEYYTREADNGSLTGPFYTESGLAAPVGATYEGFAGARLNAAKQQLPISVRALYDNGEVLNGDTVITENSAAVIKAVFTKNVFTLTASAGTGGTIDPSGVTLVNKGDSRTVTVTPQSGYEVDTFLVDGQSAALTNGQYLFQDFAQDHTVSVTFRQKAARLNVFHYYAAGQGGYIADPTYTNIEMTPGAMDASDFSGSWISEKAGGVTKAVSYEIIERQSAATPITGAITNGVFGQPDSDVLLEAGKEYDLRILYDTRYTVNHYQQKADGTYDLTSPVRTDVLYGWSDPASTVPALALLVQSYPNFNYESGYTALPIAADGSTVLNLLYARAQHKVTFDGNGATVAADPAEREGILYGATTTLPTPPQRTGYTFNGWNTEAGGHGTAFTDETLVTKDITVFAQWIAVGYTVTFAPGEHGAIVGADASGNYTMPGLTVENAFPTAPVVNAAIGYKHTGWAPALPGEMKAENQLYTATYAPDENQKFGYTIEYRSTTDNRLLNTVTVADQYPVETALTVNADASALPAGYTLSGEASRALTITAGENKVVFLAQPIAYTVTFKPGTNGTLAGAGADGNVVVNNLTVESAFPTAPAVNAAAGYKHSGWNPVLPTGNMTAGNQEYTAAYAPDSAQLFGYTIEYRSTTDNRLLNTVHPANTYTVETALTVNADTSALPAGYTLSGEASKALTITAGENKVVFLAQPTAYTVTFKPGTNGTLAGAGADGSVVVNNLTVESAFPTAPTVNAAAGYKHTGWNPALPTGSMTAGNQEYTAVYAPDEAQKFGYTVEYRSTTDNRLLKTVSSADTYMVETALTVNADASALPAGYTLSGATAKPLTIAAFGNKVVFLAQPVTYTVTFKPGDHGTLPTANSGENYVTTATVEDTFPAAPNVRTDAGYAQAGWSPVLPAAMEAQDQTYTANYVVNILERFGYTVEYRSTTDNRLLASEDSTTLYAVETQLTVNANAAALPAGYTLSGATAKPLTIAAFGNKVTFLAQPTAYTVTFKPGTNGTLAGAEADGNVVVNNLTVESAFPTAPAVNAATGYKNTGWNPALPTGSMSAGNQEYTATYAPDEAQKFGYTVEYRSTTDNRLLKAVSPTDTYPVETQLTVNADASALPAGYTLGATIQQQLTITTSGNTAVFYASPNRYPITFKPGEHGTLAGADATGNVLIENLTVENTFPTAPAVNAAAGYKNTGWSPALPAAGTQVPVGGGTYTATYAPDENQKFGYTIEYRSTTDNRLLNTVTVADQYPVETALTVNADASALPAGYTLSGEASRALTITAGENKVVFLAQPTAYTVTFKPGTNGALAGAGADGSVVVNNLTVESAFPTAPAVTTAAGYKHSGWDPVLPSGSTAKVPVGGGTYTATYAPDSAQLFGYTIEYRSTTDNRLLNTVHPANTYTVETALTVNADASALPAGYTLSGEASKALTITAGENKVVFLAQPTAYTVTFKPGTNGTLAGAGADGSVVVNNLTVESAFPTAPTVNAATGYKNTGWNPVLPTGSMTAGNQEYTAVYAPDEAQKFGYTAEYRSTTDNRLLKTVSSADTYTVETALTVNADASALPAGYTLSGASSHNLTIHADGNLVTFYAQPTAYTVTFKPGTNGTLAGAGADGSVVVNNLTVENTFPEAPAVNAAAGYKHTGWNPVLPTGNMTAGNQEYTAAYAVDTEQTFGITVKYLSSTDNRLLSTVVLNAKYPVEKEVTVTGDQSALPAGYELKAPGTQNITVTAGENVVTFYADPIHYKVTFEGGEKGQLAGEDENGNVVIKDLTVENTFPEAPAVTPNAGYRFKEWAPTVPTGNMTAGDKTYTATYEPDPAQIFNYTVEYRSSTDGRTLYTQTVDGFLVESVITLTADPAKLPEGYELQKNQNARLVITANNEENKIIFYADPIKYDVVFDPGAHGTLNKTGLNALLSWLYGEKTFTVSGLTVEDTFPKAPDVTTDTGYTFAGWSPEVPQTGASFTPAYARTYVAQYELNNYAYTIRFEDGSGNTLYPAYQGTAPFESTVQATAVNVSGYTPDATQKTLKITEKNEQNVLVFVYTANAVPVTPTPTPVTPTPPTTPAGPVLPDTPETEIVPTPETPTAPEVEQVEGADTPLVSFESWALLNLILALATALVSVLLLVGYAGKGEKEGENNTVREVKKHGKVRIFSLIPGIGALIAFFLTENIFNTMVFVDKWTLLMALIALVQLTVVFFAKKQEKDPEDQQPTPAQ